MGQVFTWEAIESRQIPSLQDFTGVVAEIRLKLQDEDSITDALVCGSVTRGDHNVRSDIDCFVIYDHLKESAAFRFMQEATESAAGKFVPLGFVPCDDLLAKTRMHHVGGSFLRHLRKAEKAGGRLKGAPTAGIRKSLPVNQELEAYLRVKMYNLQEAWSQVRTFSAEREASYLKKLLEAPMHIARKTLARIEPLKADSKQYIFERYSEIMSPVMVTLLGQLVAIDREYTELVRGNVSAISKQSYRRELERIMMASETVLDFIRLNLEHVAGLEQ